MRHELYPKDNSVDLLGRTFSDIVGYSDVMGSTPIPVGSRVTLLPDGFGRQAAWVVGKDAIVTEFKAGRRHTNGARKMWEKDQVVVRFVEPISHWEPLSDNMAVWEAAWVKVVNVGGGEITQGSYAQAEQEIWDARWLATDHSYEGWTNARTYLAALYLDNENRHQQMLLSFVRKNGTVSANRVRSYFWRENIQLDDGSLYAKDFPAACRYAQRINWQEVADHFTKKARELKLAA